jgi:hypothetical protein
MAGCSSLSNRVIPRNGVGSSTRVSALSVQCAAQRRSVQQADLSLEGLALSLFSTLVICAPAGAEELVDFGKGGNADPKSYFTVLALFLLSLPGTCPVRIIFGNLMHVALCFALLHTSSAVQDCGHKSSEHQKRKSNGKRSRHLDQQPQMEWQWMPGVKDTIMLPLPVCKRSSKSVQSSVHARVIVGYLKVLHL